MDHRRRRGFLLAAGGLLAAPLAMGAQSTPGARRIGLLLITSRRHAGTDKLMAPFFAGLQKRGYLEGRNLGIEWREAEGHFERLPELAAELVRLKPDVIVAGHHEAGVALKSQTSSIPIVVVGMHDGVSAGLIKAYARPGMNVTGVGGVSEALVAKQLELLRALVSGMGRVAVVHGPGISQATLLGLQRAAAELSIDLLFLPAGTEAALEDALRTSARERAGGLLVVLGTFVYVRRGRIAQAAIEQRMPAVSSMQQFAEAGGLASYSAPYSEYWRLAADYVDRVLRGASPADLPVQMPTTFELAINLKTATALGIVIPPTILLRADHVIR